MLILSSPQTPNWFIPFHVENLTSGSWATQQALTFLKNLGTYREGHEIAPIRLNGNPISADHSGSLSFKSLQPLGIHAEILHAQGFAASIMVVKGKVSL